MRKTLALAFLAFTLSAAANPIPLLDAEIFSIDRSHSHLGFSVGFLGLNKVRGSFKDYGATIVYDENRPERSSLTVVIDAASIDTDSEMRDKDLKGPTWFDVEKHPKIVFQSTRIEKKGGERYLLHGDLTIKGITKPIAIPMTRTIRRTADAGWGNIRIGGTGAVTIKRKDFGIDGNEFWGDKVLSDDVEISIDLLGSRPNYDRWGYQPRDGKPSIGEVLQKTVESRGGAAAAAQFRELRAQQPNDYNFGPGQLGLVVNRLMQHGKVEDALALIAAGIEAYPEEPGLYARGGEAYAVMGNKDDAIRMYEKAKALSPHGTEATEMLRRLKVVQTSASGLSHG